jgi:hypothetical protein
MSDLYNHASFRRDMVKEDLHFHGGPEPGELAPEFDLPTISGEHFRLNQFRGHKPVLIETASITCPMTAGAMPAMWKLWKEFGGQVEFVSIYVREAHPGENYPHHTSFEQKLRRAREWAQSDGVTWTVAVDDVDGHVHKLYGELPNAAYLIDRTGHVAFRALFAPQYGLLRGKLRDLLAREARGEDPVKLGQRENVMIPMLHGAAEFNHSIGRAGKQAEHDFRREMGGFMYRMEKVMSRMQPLIHPSFKHG